MSIKSGDEANSFYHDAHNLEGHCNYVMVNPPFNVDKVKAESAANAGRLPFGVPKENKNKEIGNANYLWISYFYAYLNETGRAGFVMASSATDSQGNDKDIREKLVKTRHVDVMISVGNNFFYTKSLPCSLWFFDKGKADELKDKFAGSPTIVVLTDRAELNTQISDTFENCGLLGKTKASKFIASSGNDLIHKLEGNPSFIFTLIQKFNKKVEEPIIPDHDIIIMSDEAHRSQYGVFADNMMGVLPAAARIGFTGTPLLSDDSITERTFGGYISIYDFKRAVEDKATVPLYYKYIHHNGILPEY